METIHTGKSSFVAASILVELAMGWAVPVLFYPIKVEGEERNYHTLTIA